jgi:ABC-type Fe3+-siderophore transport system permease subunit
MFSKFIRWLVWSTGGILLIGLMILHFSKLWAMPDYLILTIGICSGMYLLMFLDALTEELIGNKRRVK